MDRDMMLRFEGFGDGQRKGMPTRGGNMQALTKLCLNKFDGKGSPPQHENIRALAPSRRGEGQGGLQGIRDGEGFTSLGGVSFSAAR